MGEVQAAARRLNLEITPLTIRRAEDIAAGFAALKLKAGALYVVQDNLDPRSVRQVCEALGLDPGPEGRV